jgi:hypothetical protein
VEPTQNHFLTATVGGGSHHDMAHDSNSALCYKDKERRTAEKCCKPQDGLHVCHVLFSHDAWVLKKECSTKIQGPVPLIDSSSRGVEDVLFMYTSPVLVMRRFFVHVFNSARGRLTVAIAAGIFPGLTSRIRGCENRAQRIEENTRKKVYLK